MDLKKNSSVAKTCVAIALDDSKIKNSLPRYSNFASKKPSLVNNKDNEEASDKI